MEATGATTPDHGATPRTGDERSGGMKALAIAGGLIATLVSILWLYVFIEVLRDADETRTTTGFEKVISAVPGIPAALLGLASIVGAVLWVRHGRTREKLFRTALIGFAVATLVYVVLLII